MSTIAPGIYEHVGELAADITNATLADDHALAESLYQRLHLYHEEQLAAGRSHPFIIETLADYTDDPAQALRYYEQALAMSQHMASDEPTHTITLALAACGPTPEDPASPSHTMPQRALSALPDIDDFRRVTMSLATLDAVVCQEWAYRYYSFDAHWGSDEMASMRDGSGDHWFAVITPAGVAIHGLAHESPTFEPGHPKPWVFAELPEPFLQSLLHEPAFDTANSTYCVWRLRGAPTWSGGAADGVADGMREQLAILSKGLAGYAKWAAEYHEVDLDLSDVAAVFQHRPMTPELAARLNPDIDFAVLQNDLRSIGYPLTC